VKKHFCFCTFILLAALPLWATPVYLSFVEKGEGSIDKSQVHLKLEEVDVAVADLTYVDTTNRSSQILAHAGGRRLYIFVYDFLFSTPDSLLQARKTTEMFLAIIPPQDLISVAGITSRDGLKLFCAPTADRNKVIAGLNWMGQKKIDGMIEGPEGNLYPEDFSASNTPVGLIPDAAFLQNIKSYAVAEKDKKEVRPVLLQSLADLGFLLSALDGRKHVILFTPGADSSGLNINLPLREKVSKKRAPDQPGADIEHQDIDSITDTSASPERLQAKASVGPRRRPKTQSGETLPDLVAGTDAHVHIFHSGTQEYGLFKNLASRTEGTFVTPETDVNSTIDQIVSSDKSFYVVSGEATTDKMKDLNAVHLNVQGKEVSATQKWLIPKIPTNYTPMEKKAKIAESIYKNQHRPPASYHFWADFMLDQSSSRLPVFIQIDGPSLLQTKAEILDLEFYAFSTDKSGAVLDFSYFVFSLDLKNKSLQDKLKSSGIKIWNVLLGNVQPATVHWSIVNLQTNEMLDQSVSIEGMEPTMTLTQPFFPDLNLDWIVWPNPMQNQTKRGLDISYPYKVGADMLFFPSFSPTLKKATDGQVFFLRAYNLSTPGKIPNMRVSLVDAGGKASEIKTLGLLQNPTPVEPKGMGMFWRLATVPDLAPGDYELKVSTMDPVRNQEIIREMQTKVQ